MANHEDQRIKGELGEGMPKGEVDIISGALTCDFKSVEKSLQHNPYCINNSDAMGMTPLHISVAKNNFALASYLISQQYIDVNKVDNLGRKPIDLLGDFPNTEFRLSLLKAMYPERYKKYQNPESSLDL